ncbi:hypothetical protein AB9F42_36270, partial [Rhizobium leguminosarum]
MKRWEIANYLFDKEVLQAYTQRHGLPLDEASYDAFFTHIGNQNVKDEVNRIKNLCGIKTSINA